MNPENSHLENLSEIRGIMERSSRFISLSGLAGIFAGIVALLTAAVAFFYLHYDARYFDPNVFYSKGLYLHSTKTTFSLIILGIAALILAIGGSVYFTTRKARRNNLPVWNAAAQRMILNLFIPLFAGGMFSLVLLYHNLFFLVAPVTLIFYGLALINASKYTLREINYLGVAEVLLGLLATFFIGYGLLFWAVGFGIMHILYGILMYKRYEQSPRESVPS